MSLCRGYCMFVLNCYLSIFAINQTLIFRYVKESLAVCLIPRYMTSTETDRVTGSLWVQPMLYGVVAPVGGVDKEVPQLRAT